MNTREGIAMRNRMAMRYYAYRDGDHPTLERLADELAVTGEASRREVADDCCGDTELSDARALLMRCGDEQNEED